MKKWKKLLASVLAIAVMLSCVPFDGWEVKAKESETLVSEGYTYQVNEDGNSVTVTDYIGTDSDIEIPSEIDGKSVTSIGYWGFSGCDSLTGVTIPASVTRIGDYVFLESNNLTCCAS